MTVSLNSLTRRLIGLGMDPALANEFLNGFYFGSTANIVGAATVDAADNGSVALAGGGDSSDTRGAQVIAFGNEHASTGSLFLEAGNVSGGIISFYTAGVSVANIDRTGNLNLTASSAGLVQTAATGLTAAGSAITDALQLAAVYNNVTTVTSSTGVKLWNPSVGSTIIVKNSGASDLKLYPANSSGQLNAITAGGSTTLTTAGKQIATCHYVATNLWMVTVTSSAT